MVYKFLKSYKTLTIYKLFNNSIVKYKQYLFINLLLDHNNKRYFITYMPIFNKHNVQEKVNKNNKDHSEAIHNKLIVDKNLKENATKNQNNDTYKQHKNQQKSQQNQKTAFKKALILSEFEVSNRKEKETFLECLKTYEDRPQIRKDVASFITIAMRYMEEFGVHKDLECYKKLLDLFPKAKMVPTNVFQTITLHYAREQHCATNLLDQMENHSVIPDIEMEDMLLNIFGKHGLPTQKYWAMMYWMPKFKNLNPWPVPNIIPDNVLELAKLAMIKISSIDVQSIITVFDTTNVEDAIDQTWIVSAMAPKQNELLSEHDKTVPIFVEGPFRIYIASKAVDYFVLKAKPIKDRKYPEYDPDAMDKIRNPYLERNGDIILPPSIHEQLDSTVLAICATGTSSKDSLLSWIRCLQETNPVLGVIPIVFTVKKSTKEKMYIESGKKPEISSGELKKNDNNKLLQRK